MDSNIYMHAINSLYSRYHPKETNKILEWILKSNALLSLRKRKIKESYGFNGPDYISLCDYEKRNLCHKEDRSYTAYNGYIRRSLSLIFPKDKLTVVTPEVIDICTKNNRGISNMILLGHSTDTRYSDMYDEVQVKDKVPLSLMTGITVPLEKMYRPLYSEQKTIEYVIKELEILKQLLLAYNYDIPIYDIDTFEELDNKENIKKLVKYYYHN